MSLAAIVTMVLLATAPALAGSWSANKCGKGNFANNRDFAGLVDIGWRRMNLECHGKGSSTVVFVSGGGDRAETWSKTLDPSKQPVLPAIAENNRVCAYDRPGTVLAVGKSVDDFEPSRSDAVAQPTTLRDGAKDLHALLGAAGERGPNTDSGHYMLQEQPRLVINEVREVVAAARKKSCALGVKNHGQCVEAIRHARP
jgi:hypothetical protein